MLTLRPLILLGTALIIVPSLALVACGGGDGDESGGTRIQDSEGGSDRDSPDDAPGEEEAIEICDIVSRDEASEALGRDVLEGEYSVDNFNEATCEWEAEDDFGTISVEVRNGDPERFTEFYEFTDGEPVQGIGNRAKWDDTQGLEVLTDDYYIGVFTVNFSLSDEERRERSIDLAEQVLDRLP
ncbi:MAG TPA: hypothetical protein VG845_09725 [Dehalococcoidia bacterium]|nr:hypothetical protein [Dehalococcoidia bacterium]